MTEATTEPKAEIQTLIGDDLLLRPHNLYRWYCHDCKMHGEGDFDGAVAKRGLKLHLQEMHQA